MHLGGNRSSSWGERQVQYWAPEHSATSTSWLKLTGLLLVAIDKFAGDIELFLKRLPAQILLYIVVIPKKTLATTLTY